MFVKMTHKALREAKKILKNRTGSLSLEPMIKFHVIHHFSQVSVLIANSAFQGIILLLFIPPKIFIYVSFTLWAFVMLLYRGIKILMSKKIFLDWNRFANNPQNLILRRFFINEGLIWCRILFIGAYCMMKTGVWSATAVSCWSAVFCAWRPLCGHWHCVEISVSKKFCSVFNVDFVSLVNVKESDQTHNSHFWFFAFCKQHWGDKSGWRTRSVPALSDFDAYTDKEKFKKSNSKSKPSVKFATTPNSPGITTPFLLFWCWQQPKNTITALGIT